MNVVWMAALGLVMTVEKIATDALQPRGRRRLLAIGAALIATAVVRIGRTVR